MIYKETDVPLTCPCCGARLSFYQVENARSNLLTVAAGFACGARWDRTDDAVFGTTQLKIYSRGNWRRTSCGNAEDMLMKIREEESITWAAEVLRDAIDEKLITRVNKETSSCK